MPFAHGDMRDHTVSHTSDHGASYGRYAALQWRSRLKISFLRDFRRRSIFDFCNNIHSEADIARQISHVRKVPILLQKSAVTDDVIRSFRLGRRGLIPRPRRSLRNFYATQYAQPEWVAVAQPAMRAVADSGR